MKYLTRCCLVTFLLSGIRAQDAADPPVEDSFLVHTEPDFTIYYDPGVAADVSLAIEWVGKTFKKGADVYGVEPDNEDCGLRIYIYGTPGPTTMADGNPGESIKTGSAWYVGCQNRWNGSQDFGVVRILGASADHDYECCSALGTNYTDPENFVGVLVHEVMHHVQKLARNAIGGFQGTTGLQVWEFPKWFMEGMAEWEGKARSTQTAQRDGPSQFISVVDLKHRDKVSCCYSLGTGGIAFNEEYRTPAVFFLYLEATFGEDFAVEILNTEHETFGDAFLEQFELRSTSLEETFRDFQTWFAAQAPTEQEIRLIPNPRDRDDAERLRRLIKLLKDLLMLQARPAP